MKLSADLLQDLSNALESRHQRPRPMLGKPVIRVGRLDPAPMAARVKILPCAGGSHRRAAYASVRSVSTTGIVLVDTAYWLDGERFLVHLPNHQGKMGRSRGILCTVTHWTPLTSGLFVVSATFTRVVGGRSGAQVSSLPQAD